MARGMGEWKDLFWPGTEVLQNKLGIGDGKALARAEAGLTDARARQFADLPLPERFDEDYFRSVHRWLFQDIYDWAGEHRTVPWLDRTAKLGPDVINYPVGDPRAPQIPYQYYPASQIDEAASFLFRGLERKNWLADLPYETFLDELAEFWGELNVVHPFREGNTRTQTLFFSRLVANAGFSLDITSIGFGDGRDHFVGARFYSQATGSNVRLRGVLEDVVKQK